MSQPAARTTILNEAAALRQAGQSADALALYDAALAGSPDDIHLLNARGGLLGQMGRLDSAVETFDRAIAQAPNVAELHYNRAFALQQAGRTADALAGFERALYLKPDYPEALNNRGLVLHALGRFDEALADYGRALGLAPRYARARNNRGVTQQELGQLDAALADYDAALAIDPRYAEAHYNRGGVLGEMERLDEALTCFARATEINPRYAEAHLNDGLVRLLRGDFARGWPKYEWRDGATFSPKPGPFVQNQWRKSTDARGRTVYLHGEQGFGDTIHFSRYAALVAETGAQVMLGVPSALKALFAGLAGKPVIVSQDDVLPPFDFQRPLLSLPFVFGTTLETIPAPKSYLTAAPERVETWRGRLGEHKGLRVGICWQGSPGTKVDAGRSIPLAEFAPLAQVPGVELVSLQKVDGLDQLKTLPHDATVRTLDGLDAGPDSFVDTAAVMTLCDLVVTSDTAVAHLAGALGRPTWVALKRTPDFRWLLHRSDSPWYPSMRLFRQKTRGDWKPVFAEIADALASFELSR